MKYCLITGSAGLVGSEAVGFFCNKGYTVIGIDNDMRKYFFGTSTTNITTLLEKKFESKYVHYTCDIRDYVTLENIFKKYPTIECIIHCAAQPSHDWAAKEPLTDFSINAVATLNLLELTRTYVKSASFIYMSTNKVYGDNPNLLSMKELEKRYEVEGDGIDETMSVDNCKHSIFGVSKLSADVMVQEYGRYFDMNTVVFRGGCITGPQHQGAQLHGFLSYLVKCICNDESYTIFGYKGKQVRDNIHSYDLVNAFWSYHNNPTPAAIYNMGGGRSNSLSVIETIDKVNSLLGKNWNKYTYVNENRSGDHIWYISNLSKFKKQYPEWSISISVDTILKQIIQSNSKTTFTSKLTGGVGNQMFQIALAYAMSQKYNSRLLFEKHQFDGCRQGSHPSKYYTNLFEKIEFVDSLKPTVIVEEKQFTAYDLFPEINNYMKTLKENNFVISFKGYWQSMTYFQEYREDIKNLFTPNEGIIKFLETNSDVFDRFPELKNNNDYCFIGVRRGDYITYADVHNPCGFSYYSEAMQHLNKQRYYILSDDFEWCKKNFVGDQFYFLEVKDDLHQLLVSTLFKSYIISNSTFYWWGSFMSIYSDPFIIAPDKWLFGKDVNIQKYYSIYRPEMKILERKIEID